MYVVIRMSEEDKSDIVPAEGEDVEKDEVIPVLEPVIILAVNNWKDIKPTL